MNCSRCGAALPDNAAFCTNCANPNPGMPIPPAMPGQPGPGNYGPQGAYAPHGYGGPPPVIADYLIWSIITTLCCCLPLGIAGIVFSVQCKSEMKIGKFAAAQEKSKYAFYCNLSGLILGLIINVIVFAVQFMAAAHQAGGMGDIQF